MIVETAVQEDAAAILEILQQGFPTALLDYIPLGCPGALRYIEDQLALGRAQPDSLWTVLREPNQRVAGFIELRLYAEELLINHIYLRPEQRGAGRGAWLLRRTLELALRPHVQRVSLDVFLDNTRALAWYSRLGFVTGSTRAWSLSRPTSPQMIAHLGSAKEVPWFCTEGLPQANCVHARYGFSGFKLKTQLGSYEVGRLGAGLFRIGNSALLEDPGAVFALRELDEARSLFLINSAEGGAAGPALAAQTCVARAARMWTEPGPLIERLNSKKGEP